MKLRTLGSALAAIGMAAALGLTQTGSASAEARAYYFMAGHTYSFTTWSPTVPDGCLDDSNNSNGTDNLRAFTCNGLPFQKWTVVNNSNGWSQLKNQSTGRCLDYSLSGGLHALPCGLNNFDGGWQAWTLVDRETPGGSLQAVLKSAINQDDGTNTCVDISAAYGDQGLPCSGARQDAGYQAWSVMDYNSN